MNNNEIVQDLMKNTIIPLAAVSILGILLSPFCKVGENVDFGVLFIYSSFPFGIYLVMKRFHPDKDIKTFAKVITIILNVFGGCAIGVAALAWTLGRAFGYIPYTIWRFVMKDDEKITSSSNGVMNSSVENIHSVENHNNMETSNMILEDPLMDERQIEIMKKIQELNEKRK